MIQNWNKKLPFVFVYVSVAVFIQLLCTCVHKYHWQQNLSKSGKAEWCHYYNKSLKYKQNWTDLQKDGQYT